MGEKVYSPTNGKIMELSNVNDEVFAQRILGDGIAISPNEKEKSVVSPVNGKIKLVHEGKHAFGICTEFGTELLVHIGIETVQLKGKPFKTKVKEGDIVKKGDLLTLVDWNHIKREGCDTEIMIIVLNSSIKTNKKNGYILKGDPILEIDK